MAEAEGVAARGIGVVVPNEGCATMLGELARLHNVTLGQVLVGSDEGPAIDGLASIDRTAAIAVVLDVSSRPDGQALLAAIRASGVPLVALLTGAPESRPSALALVIDERAAWAAALRQAGAVVADDLEALLDAAVALTRLEGDLPASGRVAAVATPGTAALIEDACRAAGLALPRLEPDTHSRLSELLGADVSAAGLGGSPLELSPELDDERLGKALRAIRADRSVDGLLLATVLPIPRAAQAGLGPALSLADIPEPRRLARAYRACLDAAQRRHQARPARPPAVEPMNIEGTGIMDEAEAKRLLDRWGIPVVPETLVTGPGRHEFTPIRKLATHFTFPVVLKAIREDIVHKSSMGAVVVGVPNIDQLQKAWEAMHAKFPDAAWLVQPYLAGDVEVVIGAWRHPALGPVVSLGGGGIMTDLYRDTAVRVAPLTHDDALAMIEETRVADLLRGFAGLPPHDPSEVAAILVRIGWLMLGQPTVQELEIGPLLLGDKGAAAVDAKAVIR